MSKTRLDVIRELLEKDPELFSGNRDRGKQSNLIDLIVELENRIEEQDARIAELEAIIKNLETQLQNSMDVARLMLMSMSYVDSLDSKGLSDEFEDYRRFDDPPEEEVEPTPVQTEALWRTLRNSTTLLPGDPEEEA